MLSLSKFPHDFLGPGPSLVQFAARTGACFIFLLDGLIIMFVGIIIPYGYIYIWMTIKTWNDQASIKIVAGWWLTYPSEKWWSSSVRIIVPKIWKIIIQMFQSPPTSLFSPEPHNHRTIGISTTSSQWKMKDRCLKAPGKLSCFATLWHWKRILGDTPWNRWSNYFLVS